MIESICIKNVASYGDEEQRLSELSKRNFIYGANGTGKTTISRVIADKDGYPECTINWQGGVPLETCVYNCDFVEKNFDQELKGIFTLGEKDANTIAKIDAVKEEIDGLKDGYVQLKKTLNGDDDDEGKVGELQGLEVSFEQQCWKLKKKYDANFPDAFSGVRNSTLKFKERLLEEVRCIVPDGLSIDDLEKKAETVFGKAPQAAIVLTPLNVEAILAHESNPILKKKVIGETDVDIAALILKLSNSDWVKEGRQYYDPDTRKCPFCQQATDEKLEENLNSYFNEAFEADIKSVETLFSNYKTDAERLQQTISTLLDNSLPFLDAKAVRLEKDLLNANIQINIQRIEEKMRESSKTVELKSLSNICTTIVALIDAANDKIKAHNQMVANLDAEKRILIKQVWKHLLENEINVDLSSYKEKKRGLTKAIKSLNKQLEEKTKSEKKKTAELRALEKDNTSIQPTIDGINELLDAFGFYGFKLAKSDREMYYKIVRLDGSDAKKTLSEGEKTFVTFLYFYHLIKGSENETGMTTDRVIVIDDPVSSLDSDILFIVSSLIKKLFEEVQNGAGTIKQVFVLTHNVYFHKEVSFKMKRRKGIRMNGETFWTVRKPAQQSKINRHKFNPIKTSYELLWLEVRNPDRSNLAIQNALRRILENYFKILGGVDSDSIYEKFEGKERLTCKSLFSWVNDGSHFAQDDLYVSIDEGAVENYLGVFKAVFEKTGHISHYNMMMSAEGVVSGEE